MRDALVKALGAKYAELADTAGQWLCQEDKSILPLLTQGFDPAGKKEMARRVQVIDTIAGGSLNDWYISQLEGAKKQVRVMLIYALRHCPENLELLLKLAKTEKYDNKDAARWALARIQNPGALPFWREMMEADLIENGRFFMASNSPAATALTAELLERELEDLLAPDDAPWYTEKEKRLANLLYALVGKTGPAICDAYRKGAALGTKLDGSRAWKNGKGHINEQMFFQRPGGQKHPFSVALVEVLNQSIQWNPDPGLCTLAEELYESYGGLWAGPAVCAALLTKGAEEAAAVGKKLLGPKPPGAAHRQGGKAAADEPGLWGAGRARRRPPRFYAPGDGYCKARLPPAEQRPRRAGEGLLGGPLLHPHRRSPGRLVV